MVLKFRTPTGYSKICRLTRMQMLHSRQESRQFCRIDISVSAKVSDSGSPIPGCVWMRLFVRFPQAPYTDMGVTLSRCQTLLALQFLHTSQVSPSIKEMCCKTMPQSMRRSLLRKTRSLDVFFQHSADASSRQTSSESIEKQSVSLLLFCFWRWFSNFQPAQQRLRGKTTDRRNSLFAPLSQNSQNARRSVPVAEIEPDKFSDAESGGVGCFENCSVSNSLVAVCWRCQEKCIDLFGCQEVWQFSAGSGSSERSCWICFAKPFAVAEPEKRSEASESPCHSRSGILAFMEPGDIGPQQAHIDVSGCQHSSGLLLNELQQVRHIVGVRLNGKVGRVSFDPQVVQKSLDGLLHDNSPVRLSQHSSLQNRVGKSSVWA